MDGKAAQLKAVLQEANSVAPVWREDDSQHMQMDGSISGSPSKQHAMMTSVCRAFQSHGWQWVPRCERSCVAGHRAGARCACLSDRSRGMYSASQENLIAQAPQRKIMPFKPLAPHGLSNNLQIQILMNVGFILFLFAVSSMECCSHLSLLQTSLDGVGGVTAGDFPCLPTLPRAQKGTSVAKTAFSPFN